MNAASPIARATSDEWECVNGNWFIMTADDLDDSYGAFTCADTGKVIAYGHNKLGIMVRVQLNVPLCGGCDQPLDGSVCHDCQLVHGDVPLSARAA